jgi:hypothetical protein
LYAVEFFLRLPIDDFVRDIWRELKERDITSHMANIKELTPHLNVGVYNSELFNNSKSTILEGLVLFSVE